MPTIHIPAPAQSAPIGRARLDLENPLTRGLAYAVVHGEQWVSDSVRDRFADSGVAVSAPSSAGIGLRYTTFATFSAPSDLVTSNGSYTGDFTLLSLSAPAAVATRDALVSNAVFSGNQCYLFANMSSSYSSESGTLSFGGFPMGWVSSPGRIDGRPHVYLGMRQGSAGYLDIDGVEVATNGAIGTGSIGSTTAKLAVGGIYGYSGYTNPDTPHHLTLVWNRSLSKSERIMIGTDPWQIFRGVDDAIYTAAGTITLNSLTASNITSSGVRITLGVTR